MDIKQIKEIIAKGENQEVEFKESFHSNQDISKILCALANTFGGLLFIGVKDNGDIAGLKENIDKLQQKIADANQCISPVPIISVEIHEANKNKIAIIIVQRAADSQYFTFQGAIYVRFGSTTQRLEGQTHLEFLRNKQILSFDETFDSLAKIEDIDDLKINGYLQARKQGDYLSTHSIKDFLISNRLASEDGSLKIKNSAIIIFAKNPTRFHPQIEIKLVKFSGKEPVDIVAHKLLQNNIVDSIEQSILFIKENMKKTIKMVGIKHEEVYEYPESVIRESIVNAIAHRDYFSKDSIQISLFKNRIEITNPGSLPQGLPKELFGTISVQRNPITYRILRDLGYVEGLGTGIPRMKNDMRKIRLDDPQFIFTESFFRIILYNQKGAKKAIETINDLNERQKKAIEYLKSHKSIKSKTYKEINNVSHATAVHELNEMIDFSYVKKIGSFRGAYYILNER